MELKESQGPLVSVLMTVFNREQFLQDSIESVLASTYQDYELVLVDDGSNDKSVSIAKDYEKKYPRIRVFQNEINVGDYPNRNIAAAYAKGKYIKYLDSDDIIYPHGLQVMVNAMEQFPDAGYGLSSHVDRSGPYPICISPLETYREHFNGFGHFERAPGSAIIKRSVFEEVGGFSGERMIGDMDLWMRISLYYPLVKLPRDLVWNRVHEGQESKTDYAKKYYQLRKNMITRYFSSPACPLSEVEKALFFSMFKRRQVKNLIKKWL